MFLSVNTDLQPIFFFRFYDQIQWLELDIDIMFVFVDEFKYALNISRVNIES